MLRVTEKLRRLTDSRRVIDAAWSSDSNCYQVMIDQVITEVVGRSFQPNPWLRWFERLFPWNCPSCDGSLIFGINRPRMYRSAKRD